MPEFNERPHGRGSQNYSGLSEQIFGDGRNSNDRRQHEERSDIHTGNNSRGSNPRPNAQRIIGQIVTDLIVQNGRIGPGYQRPGYPQLQPGFDPSYQPGFDPRQRPNYDPRYQPGFDPRQQPNYDPRYQPGFDPRQQQNYDPRYQPGFDTRQQPNYDPRYQPGYDQRYQPAFDPRYSPSIHPGRFNSNGPLRNLIRQSINDLRNNPQGIEGLINNLGSLSQDMRFNVDQERREISLGMDFTKAYDMLKRQDGTPENPEVRRLLAGLDSIQVNPDALALNWKSEQLVALDQPNGPKDLRLLLGGQTNRTTLNIATSETAVRLSNIQGLEVVDPSGRRMCIYGVDIDSSNPQEPKGTITIDNPIPRPEQLPPGTPWPEQVGLPIPITTDNQKQAVPRLVSQLHRARTAAINGDFGEIISSVNPQELSTLIEMLKPPQTPQVPESPQTPMVPEPPRPGIQPEIRPAPSNSPQEGVIEVNPIPGYEVQPQSEGGREQSRLPGVTEIPSVSPPIDYLDVFPLPQPVSPDRTGFEQVTPPATPEPFQHQSSSETQKPEKSSTPWDLPAARTKPSLSSTIDLFRPVARTQNPTSTPATVSPPLTVTPQRTEPGTPTEQNSKPEATEPIKQPTDVSVHKGGRTTDILRASGIKITAAEKIGPDKLFSLIFADADQHGPLVTGFKGKIQDLQFRRDLDAVGKTLNRFDVDKANKAITVGLDFAKVYDTFDESGKQKPETRQFLSGLKSVTVSPDQLKLNFDAPRKLAMDGDGLKKADLWLGMFNNQTSFDIQTTESALALKNIKGLQAEVQALGKKLNVYEVTIDTSTGTPSATALVDNPFAKPPGVSDDLWQSTMSIPLELGKTEEERIQVAQRLPQTLRSLHAMRQGALNGGMAERIGQLTKEEIIDMLRFQ
ncbi:hypothetical protein KF728_02845 [Candidatus Obscuribacterales bacterium]|nr:hypothetical protein [Candidatus Obscuribacterales bacterium]